ncbi:MAG: hypothetical protein Alis3KO_00660 [Aliiglaciecola sp.]
MNRYNTAIMAKCEKLAKALNQLNQYDCAILSMAINENVGASIKILPPRNQKLKGVQTSIKGDLNGRQYLMQARLHGCTVTWEQEQQPLMRHSI